MGGLPEPSAATRWGWRVISCLCGNQRAEATGSQSPSAASAAPLPGVRRPVGFPLFRCLPRACVPQGRGGRAGPPAATLEFKWQGLLRSPQTRLCPLYRWGAEPQTGYAGPGGQRGAVSDPGVRLPCPARRGTPRLGQLGTPTSGLVWGSRSARSVYAKEG